MVVVVFCVLWLISLALLLKPFITKKKGLETLDALDIFTTRQGILLCLLVFACYPCSITGFVAFLAILPKPTFTRNLILACLSVVGLEISRFSII